MCIIAIKPKNKDLQNKDTLQTCFNRNHDGAGYMFVNDKNEVVIKKGYMTFDNYYKDLMKDYDKYGLKDKNLVMHFRIGTSGQSKLGCTHPFAITNDYNVLNTTHLKTNIGVCHNGIISKYNDRLGKYSDTQIYIAKVLTPLIRLNINAYKFKDIQEIIKDTTNSKWAFLDKFDEVYTVGDFVEDGGYLYSNSTYKAYKPVYSGWDFDYGTYDWFRYQKDKQDKQNQLDKQNKEDKECKQDKHENKSIIKSNTNELTTYKGLKKGNVFISDEVPYMVTTKDYEYYFDKECNIYKIIDRKFTKIASKACIYTNETFVNRRDFYDKF